MPGRGYYTTFPQIENGKIFGAIAYEYLAKMDVYF